MRDSFLAELHVEKAGVLGLLFSDPQVIGIGNRRVFVNQIDKAVVRRDPDGRRNAVANFRALIILKKLGLALSSSSQRRWITWPETLLIIPMTSHVAFDRLTLSSIE
ncbi:hypothetical protein THH46_10945 [Pseudomonas sp. NA13]